MRLLASVVAEIPGQSTETRPCTLPRRPLFWGVVTGLVCAAAVQGAYVFLGSNFHTVVSDRIYRCAQPSPEYLEHLVHACKIRTVINLRGKGETPPWYLAECRTTRRLNVAMEDIGLWACLPPPPLEIRRLVEVLDHAEYPILMHCNSGGDRAGLASAVALLLQDGVPLDRARAELTFCYGHYPYGKARCLQHFFDAYALWLRARHCAHGPDRFRWWLVNEYRPEQCW